MVNRKGLKALGSDSPEEIIGKTLRIEREAVGYIPQGVVCGVTDDDSLRDVADRRESSAA